MKAETKTSGNISLNMWNISWHSLLAHLKKTTNHAGLALADSVCRHADAASKMLQARLYQCLLASPHDWIRVRGEGLGGHI